MARPNKRLRYNILIVCEGTNTEPQYFSSLKNLAQKAWSDSHQLSISIKPKPKLEEETSSPKPSKHKTRRKKRTLKNVENEPIHTIEDEYKAVPVRYVREAQQGLEDGVYEETWAVFDKDYHPKHQAAFELAQQEIAGKKAQIAFSSISFEHWILLHFEKNMTAFVKSECKEHHKSIDCGTLSHSNDCYGATCVSGHLRTCQYVSSYSKNSKASFFSTLHSNIHQAIENAAWLRYQVLKNNPNTPIYELNPYTNMDKLVKHLLQIQEEVVWIGFDEIKDFKGLKVQFSQQSATEIALKLTNRSKAAYLFLPEHVYLQNTNHPIICARTIVQANESQIILLKIPNIQNAQLCFMLKNGRIMLNKY